MDINKSKKNCGVLMGFIGYFATNDCHVFFSAIKPFLRISDKFLSAKINT